MRCGARASSSSPRQQTGQEAVELTLHYRPDVVLMDVVMPELDGLGATRRIVKERPEQVIVDPHDGR